jgi:Na+-driven multidrug efflux pump
VIAPDLLLRVFLHDEHTIALARLPRRLLGITMAVETVGSVLMNAVLGAGASKTVMFVSVTLQWGLFLPVAFLIGPVFGFGMSAVWAAQVGYRCLQGLTFASIWRSRKWIHLDV